MSNVTQSRSDIDSSRHRRRRRLTLIALPLLALVASGCRTGTVDHVVDGDTVDVNGIRVRVIGIDTPERGQCGYREATRRVEELVGDQGVLVLDVEGEPATDRYGRELGYIRRRDFDLGTVLIAEGLAHARYDSLDGYSSHPLQDRYHELDASTRNLCE